MEYAAARLLEPKHVEVQRENVPKLKPGEIMVGVTACGVCSSELPVWTGASQNRPGVSFRYATYPASLGHEVVGIIEAVEESITEFWPGEKVTGIAYKGSGFATHVIEPADKWVRVPDGFDLEYVLGEPLAATVNIVRMSEPQPGDTVLVVGDGFMALAATALLARYPIDKLIVVGHHDYRLELAEEMGATHVVNNKDKNAYWDLRRIIGGKGETPWLDGADLVFEFAGKMSALQLCASMCKPKKRTKLMLPSFYENEPFTIGHYLMNRGPMLIPCHPAHSLDFMDDLRRAMLLLVDGVWPMEKLITHKFGLHQIGKAFDIVSGRREGYIKGIVVP